MTMTEQKPVEYRFYGFGNYYLSSLQQGLQAGHAITELFVNHKVTSSKYKQVQEWGANHKTMVLLKGGNSADLANLYEFFQDLEKQGMPYPFTKFHEDEVSLGGALTYVGAVFPNEIYDTAAAVRMREISEEELLESDTTKNKWKSMLILRLNYYGLAS